MRILIAASAAFLLAGCTATIGKIDTVVQASLPTLCGLIAVGSATFDDINARHPLSAGTVEKKRLAVVAAEVPCADPSKVTTANTLKIVAEIYAVVAAALREAERVEEAAATP